MHQRKALVELYQYAKFCVASSKFPESKGALPMHMHVHYVPYHEMTCTIELRSLNSISVPNLVSIGEHFL